MHIIHGVGRVERHVQVVCRGDVCVPRELDNRSTKLRELIVLRVHDVLKACVV